jgi:tetratricopeptide (TPR) repeat protein
MGVGRRCFLLVTAVVIGGCAARPAAQVVVREAQSQSALGWTGRANLTLDQISPMDKLQLPATVPADRPPIEALVLYSQSRDATVRGDPQAAISALQQAIVLDPYRFALRYDLGWAYVNANENDQRAIVSFEKAASLEPNHIDVQTELGRLYLTRNDLPAAIAHLRLATQTSEYSSDDGKAAVADFFLGRALKDAGYDRAALNQYGVLVARFEHPSLSLQQNGDLSYLLDRPDSLFVEIGELLEKHREYAEAIESFKPAVDRQPDNFDLQARYARDLAMDGQREAALKTSVELIVRNRASAASLGVLKDVCRGLNLPNGVMTTLQKLNQDRPGDQAVLFALVDTLVARHRAEEAQNLLETAWGKSPTDIPITRRLFSMDKQNDAVPAAAKMLIHALAVNPDALQNYLPLWAELLRPGLPNRLTLGSIASMKVPVSDEAARQYWLALTAEDQGRPSLQRQALEASTRIKPPFAPAFRELLILDWSQVEWSNEQKIRASDQLSGQAKEEGDAALAAELVGRSLVKQGKWSLAVDQFTQAVRLGGRSAELILAGSNASRGPGRDPKYEQLLWALVSDRPWFEDGYTALFQYYISAEPPATEQAMKVLSTWLASDPQSMGARLAQADVDIREGQTREVEQELSRLFQDDPDDPEVFRLMLRYYTQAGRVNDLISKLEDQRASQPRDTDVVGRLVLLYAQQKRNAEASRLLDSTRVAVADDADLLYSLASLYQELNQKQTAEDVLQQVVQLDPSHAGACNDLGFDWADQGKNLARAEALIRAAVAAEPDNESFLDSLGWVLYKRGKFDEARQYLQQAIGPAALPDPVVLDHLGDTLYRLSRTDDAYKAWQQSLKGLGDSDAARDDLRQLRLHLMQKIQQAEAKKPVDVAAIPGQLSVVSGPLSGPATHD